MNDKIGRLFSLGFLALCVSYVSVAKEWFPIEVDVWTPPFNTERERETKMYTPLEKAQRPWKICVAIPHLKDAYWLVVNFALIEEAKRLGVRLRINEAGGYDHLELQRNQVKKCMASGADGLILSAVNATGLNDLIDEYAKEKRPVVDLINGIDSNAITARAAATYFDNGQLSAKYLNKLVVDERKNILWLPGPRGPVWSVAADNGFTSELKDNFTILDTLWGDTDKSVQGSLIKEGLKRHKNIDYIVGTSVSSDVAVSILKTMKLDKKIDVLAYYYAPGVHKNISRGHVISGVADQQAIQAKISLDMMVRKLEGSLEIKHAGPKVLVVDKQTFRHFDPNTSIPPKGFSPIFSFRDWVREK